MKLATTTNVSVDGVMQGLGGPDEDRIGGFERGGCAMPLFDNEAAKFLYEVYQRSDAFLFGRVHHSQGSKYPRPRSRARSPLLPARKPGKARGVERTPR
jgi:hypothetical protein